LTVRVESTKGFDKAFAKLKDARRQRSVMDAVDRLIENRHHPSLNLERMQSTDTMWTIRTNLRDRIILKHEPEVDPDLFTLIDVGPHDIYRKYG